MKYRHTYSKYILHVPILNFTFLKINHHLLGTKYVNPIIIFTLAATRKPVATPLVVVYDKMPPSQVKVKRDGPKEQGKGVCVCIYVSRQKADPHPLNML